jgi:hypothetical protein
VWCNCYLVLFRLGCHYGACLAYCFTLSTAASVALYIILVMLLAMHRASLALPMLLRSSLYLVMVC